jgi:hypothetical protein
MSLRNLSSSWKRLIPSKNHTFIQSVSSVIKGIGASVVAVFKKIGDGIVNLAQNIFGLNKKPETPVTASPQGLNGSFKNLVEVAPGVLQTQNGKTTALGQIWEPGIDV